MNNFEKHELNINENELLKHQSQLKFMQGITTMSTALLGILISFKPEVINNDASKYLFIISIILIGFVLILSLISLHYSVDYHNQKAKASLQMLKEYMDSNQQKGFQLINITKKKIYSYSENMTYICLALSVITLILYTCFSLLS